MPEPFASAIAPLRRTTVSYTSEHMLMTRGIYTCTHICQPYRFWRDSTDNLPILYRHPAPMRFCTDLLARVRSRFSAPSARARGRGRSLAPGEFCGSVEPRLYFPTIDYRLSTISINYNHVIIILYVKWVESVGVSKGVWFVPTFLFEKLATMCTVLCVRTVAVRSLWLDTVAYPI